MSSFWNNTTSITYEGYDDTENRELVPRENQYDMWKRSYKYQIYDRDISESFCFPAQIFETITEANLNNKLMDYQRLFKQYRGLCLKTVNIKFISKYAYEANQDAQRVFLCILLGIFVKSSYHNHEVRLENAFPSADLLNSLAFIDGDSTMLKEAVDFLSHAVRVLVRHNWHTSYSFEWLRMFEVAAFIDPKYSFLDSVRRRDLNPDESDRFCKLLLEQKPNVEREKDYQYLRFCRVSTV